MKKYMLLYKAPIAAEAQMNVSPEEMKKGMEPWMAWFSKCGAAIVDGGAPLGKGTQLFKSEETTTSSQIAGYTILQAENMDTVKKMVEGHPHFMLPDASIEILEIMPMSM